MFHRKGFAAIPFLLLACGLIFFAFGCRAADSRQDAISQESLAETASASSTEVTQVCLESQTASPVPLPTVTPDVVETDAEAPAIQEPPCTEVPSSAVEDAGASALEVSPSPTPAGIPVIGEAAEAENLSEKCKYYISNADVLMDDNKKSYIDCRGGRELKITWRDNVPVRSVLLQFSVDCIVPYTVCQYDGSGELIGEVEGTQFYNNGFEIDENARELRIVIGEKETTICTLALYGEGAVPNYHPWKDKPEKADYMVIATHSDDEVLFMGGIIPTYGAEQGREGIQVISCCRSRKRMDECMNGIWTLGLRSEPIFAGFKDNSSSSSGVYPLDTATLTFVRLFRQYRPEVVITHDPNGEYGHWQHKRTAEAVTLAIEKAADPMYDQESAEQYGVWQVKKLYMHLYTENAITLDIHAPLKRFGGKTAFEVMEDAYACHLSQVAVGEHWVQEGGVYTPSAFGLKYSAVGPDTEGVNDMFEHIDESVLHSH